jgi:hypothetical protein
VELDEFCCQTPPGGLIQAWKAMLAITVANTINVPRVSSIQFSWYFRCFANDEQTHPQHLLNLDQDGRPDFASRASSIVTIRLGVNGGEEFRSVDLLRLASFTMFWISKHLKSLGQISKTSKAV